MAFNGGLVWPHRYVGRVSGTKLVMVKWETENSDRAYVRYIGPSRASATIV
jgi:hypothetical protein